MKQKTVLLCAALLALLVQPSYQHRHNYGALDGSNSQSYSSASASSYASASSFSSSNSFGGKNVDYINEIGNPSNNGFSYTKGGGQAGANAFASAGAQAGSGVFGAGADSKASAGAYAGSGAFSIGAGSGADDKASGASNTFGGSRGPILHGLGVGGGIGIDNYGTIDGTTKYGSGALKHNCGGGSCSGGTFGSEGFGFSGAGSIGGSSGAGSSYPISGPGFDKIGNTGSGSSGSYSGGFGTGINGITGGSAEGCDGLSSNCNNGKLGAGGTITTGSGYNGFNVEPSGCGGSSGDCDDGSYSNSNPSGVGETDSGTLTGPGAIGGCGGAPGGCGSLGGQYPSHDKPLPQSPGFATGSVTVTKPTGEISGTPLCSASDSNCKGIPIDSFAPGYAGTPGTGFGASRPGFVTGGIQVVKPVSGGSYYGKPQLSIDSQVPSYQPGVKFTGSFPGPGFGIGHSIPASPGAGVTASAGATSHAGSGIIAGGGAPYGTHNSPSFVGHYSGPFPGPSGSIHQSKPASEGKPVTSVAHAGAGSTAGSLAGTTTSGIFTGTSVPSVITTGHYTGPFPGPSGSIDQSKPAAIGKPIIPGEHAGAGSTASASAGATASGIGTSTTVPSGISTGHYSGPFPGPSEDINQSKPSSVGKPVTSTAHAGAGSTAGAFAGTTAGGVTAGTTPSGGSTGSLFVGHYSGPFPGPIGSIDQAKPASEGKHVPSTGHAGAGSTAGGFTGTTSSGVTAGTTPSGGSTGSSFVGHYSGPFPGPTGGIDQAKPASEGKYVTSTGNAGAGASAQAGSTFIGTHFTGTFPSPTGTIHQGTTVPDVTSKPGFDSQYTRPFSTGEVYKSTPTAGASATAGSSASSGASTNGKFIGTTAYTEKPIINIIPISRTTPGTVLSEKTTTNLETVKTDKWNGDIGSTTGTSTVNGCEFGDCSPKKPSSDCSGLSCGTPDPEYSPSGASSTGSAESDVTAGSGNNIVSGCSSGNCSPKQPATYFIPGKPAVQIPISGSIGSCTGSACDGEFTTGEGPRRSDDGYNANGGSGTKESSGFSTTIGLGESGANTGSSSEGGKYGGGGSTVPSTGCSGSSCDLIGSGGLSENIEFGSKPDSDSIENSDVPFTGCVGTSCGSIGASGFLEKPIPIANAGSGSISGSYSAGNSGPQLNGCSGSCDTTGSSGVGGNAGSNSKAGSYSSSGSGIPFSGCSGSSCGSSGFGAGGSSDCGGIPCGFSKFGSNAFSGASSGSFGGSFSGSKSGSGSFSNSKGGASSHSFANSGSSSGSFSFPVGFGGAQSASYASAQSSASSGHY